MMSKNNNQIFKRLKDSVNLLFLNIDLIFFSKINEDVEKF